LPTTLASKTSFFSSVNSREWTPLAEQGHARAQASLGMMYAEGRGVIPDYKTAIKWHTLAADQGNALAQATLGILY